MPRKNITPINRKPIVGRILKTVERKPERKGGRGRKKISISRVQKMFQAGCTSSEVCSAQAVCLKTMQDFVYEQTGMKLGEFKQFCAEQGNATLREVQYDKAVAGDNTMLIFLGKDRLGQSDRRDLNLHVDIFTEFVNTPSKSLLQVGETVATFEDRMLEGA